MLFFPSLSLFTPTGLASEGAKLIAVTKATRCWSTKEKLFMALALLMG